MYISFFIIKFQKMTFLDLAELILNQSDKPLTANEIWQLAEEKGLTKQ